jgi:hypothetical protein
MSDPHPHQADEKLFQAILLWGEAHGYQWNSQQLLLIASNVEAYLELLAGNMSNQSHAWQQGITPQEPI